MREELEALERRVATGKLKAPEKIGAAAARILARNHGIRYYDWKLEDGRFRYFEHPVNLKQEQALEGKYLIQTEEADLSAMKAVEIYKELSEVERAFSKLKDVIEMRPIYHQKAQRVQAHIFVASLAFLLDRALEKKLKSAGLDLSSKEAWQILKTVRVVEIDLAMASRSVRSLRAVCGPHGYCELSGSKILNPMQRQRAERRPHSDTCQNPTLYFQEFTGVSRKHGLEEQQAVSHIGQAEYYTRMALRSLEASEKIGKAPHFNYLNARQDIQKILSEFKIYLRGDESTDLPPAVPLIVDGRYFAESIKNFLAAQKSDNGQAPSNLQGKSGEPGLAAAKPATKNTETGKMKSTTAKGQKSLGQNSSVIVPPPVLTPQSSKTKRDKIEEILKKGL